MSRPSQGGVSGPAITRRGGAAQGRLRADGKWRDGAEGAARAGETPRSLVRPAVGPGLRSTYRPVVGRGYLGSAPPEAGATAPILGPTDGPGVLPVFGFEEEAGLSARLSRRGGRGVLRIGIDEPVSLLRGPSGGVDLVDAEADVPDGSVSLTGKDPWTSRPDRGPLAGRNAALGSAERGGP